jgi:hypothetical protein
VELDVRLDEMNPGDTSSVHFVEVKCSSAPLGGATTVYTKFETSRRVGIEQQGGAEPPDRFTATLGTWAHVAVLLRRDADVPTDDVYDVQLWIDGTAYPGNSGSPLYDPLDGTVYGIINSVFIQGTRESAIGRPSGITYAIPSRHVREMLQRQKVPGFE